MPNPPRRDIALALALAIPSLVQVIAFPIAARPLGILIALGSTLPIAFRRTNPVAAAIAGTALWVIPTDGYVALGYVAAFILFYSLGAYSEDSRATTAALVFGCITTGVGWANNGETVLEGLGAMSAVIAPALIGRVARRQREQQRRLQELTVHLEYERERGARAAVAEERARIARELHDVVAHSVSVIAIQSDAAEAALDKDAELARAPLRHIRVTAGEALGEMRRLLGVLREDGDGSELAPQPGIEQLPSLLDRLREAGVPVELEITGEPRVLPVSVDLSAYRIVQEALTNVRKHAAGASATVHLGWEGDALAVGVKDCGGCEPNGNGHGHVNGRSDGGHGLVGMRERVRLHGGELHAGPLPDGGYEVAALLPLEGHA